jgi:hypothetical protein
MTTSNILDVDWLKVDQNKGYGPLPIPNERDAQISSLLRDWMALDESSRVASSRQLSKDCGSTLRAFSERMASLAVRERKSEHILLGPIALGLDGWRGDWRDNVIVLSLLYDAPLRIGVSPDELFLQAAKFLPEKVADAYKSFLHRTDHDKSIEVMGYLAGVDADGFRYIRNM